MWYSTVRENTRENPDTPITKRKFAAMLAETHMKFYKPSIIVGKFQGARISPLNRDLVSVTSLKLSLTFTNSPVTFCKNNVPSKFKLR